MAIATEIKQQVYDLLSRTSNLSFVTVDQESDAIVTGLTPGQRVTAEVLATLPDNRVQVQVGSQQFNLNLPIKVRQGQSLEMTFVSDDPRSTFAIARPGVAAPSVSLSDASRLMGLLVEGEEMADPGLRASLQSVGDMVRRSSGEAGVLANLMDEALTYGGILRDGGKSAPPPATGMITLPDGEQEMSPQQPDGRIVTPEQARLTSFENNASQILQNMARNSRFTMVGATNQPIVPLPLMPGEEVDALVTGTLSGGRVFVKVAGTALELTMSRPVETGDLLRLTYLSSTPKPLFGIARTAPDVSSGVLSEAGRWLSALEHGSKGVSGQQLYILERLNLVLKSLPPNSPAFTAILDEAITYDFVMRGGQQQVEQTTPAGAAAVTAQPPPPQQGSGIMLSDDMAKLLQSLIKGNRLALLEALNQQSTSSGFALGQQIKGEILASLGGGRFMVQLAEREFEFSLPKALQTGNRLNFFFITDDPQPTFLVARFGRTGDSQVSDTGRWLSSLLGAATETMTPQTAMGILRALLSGPPVHAGQVGLMLQQGLRESGLFYESHLARWFCGDYPLEEILREPQGRLSHLKLPMTGMPAESSMEGLARAGMKTGSLEVMEAIVKRAGVTMAHEGIADQRSLALVREQMDSLQSGQVIYRGELFPGQQMEWTVQEREAERNRSDNQGHGWDTTMRLDLPLLGAVTARLTLNGTRVSVALSADDATSAALIDAGRPELREQLEAAGLAPGEIGVVHGTA